MADAVVWLAWLHDGYGYGRDPDQLLAVCPDDEQAKLACTKHLANLGRTFMSAAKPRPTISEWRDFYDLDDADDPDLERREHTRYADARDRTNTSRHYRIERWEVRNA